MSDNTEPRKGDDLGSLSDDELEEELTIAASGLEEDEEREERFHELLDEREHRHEDD